MKSQNILTGEAGKPYILEKLSTANRNLEQNDEFRPKIIIILTKTTGCKMIDNQKGIRTGKTKREL